MFQRQKYNKIMHRTHITENKHEFLFIKFKVVLQYGLQRVLLCTHVLWFNRVALSSLSHLLIGQWPWFMKPCDMWSWHLKHLQDLYLYLPIYFPLVSCPRIVGKTVKIWRRQMQQMAKLLLYMVVCRHPHATNAEARNSTNTTYHT